MPKVLVVHIITTVDGDRTSQRVRVPVNEALASDENAQALLARRIMQDHVDYSFHVEEDFSNGAQA